MVHHHHLHSPRRAPPPLFDVIVTRNIYLQQCLIAHLDDKSLSALRKTARRFKYFGRVSPFADMICRYVPVQSTLLANMEITDVIALSRTSKALSDIYQIVARTQYNIDRALAPFFSSSKGFRNLQAKTDAIVSGYFAIDFFDRRNPVRDEAILQIQVGKASVNMTLAYLEEDGWEIIHDTCPEDDVCVDGFYRLIRFFKVSRESIAKGKDDPAYRIFKMHILVTERYPLFTLLKNCAITNGFTFITWSHAYCLTPELTFGRRQMHIREPALRYGRQWVSRSFRNNQRDFDREVEPIDIRDIQRDNDKLKHPCKHIVNSKPSRVDLGPRRIGDKYTWSIPFSTEGIQSPASPLIVTTHAMFRILPVPHPDIEDPNPNMLYPTAHYKFHAEIINVPCLKHNYLTYPCEMTKVAPHLCMKRYIDISRMQLESMAIGDRPPGYDTIGSTQLEHPWSELRPPYTPPRYWKYHDEEVQQILRERWSVRHEGNDML